MAALGQRCNLDTLVAIERVKYEKMWAQPIYRKVSPGEIKHKEAVYYLGPNKGSLIDFGIGTGRGANMFKQAGYDVLGIDICASCLDPGIDIEVWVCALWEIPGFIKADYGLCTDVMEHIPPSKVDLVLERISGAVSKCYFSIDTIPDSLGKLIGETLHACVESADWWEAKLLEHFDKVKLINTCPSLSTYYCEVK